MAKINFGKFEYITIGRFAIGNGNNQYERGIKLHIAANAENAQSIADQFLPTLNGLGVFHKVIADTDNLSNDRQGKKFITIYPQGANQLNEVTKCLVAVANNLIASPVEGIQGDAQVGASGYIYARYGYFNKNSSDDDRGNAAKCVIDWAKSGLVEEGVFTLDQVAISRRRRYESRVKLNSDSIEPSDPEIDLNTILGEEDSASQRCCSKLCCTIL